MTGFEKNTFDENLIVLSKNPYRKCSTRLVQLSELGGSRSQLGDRPSALARPGWLDLASTGSIWLPLAPLLGPSGLEWLDLPAPRALAGSIWMLWAVLGDPLARLAAQRLPHRHD